MHARYGGHPQSRAVLTCWLTYAAFYLGRANLAVALPALEADLGWSRTAVGLVGAGAFWAYALGQLAHGQLGERIPARGLVAAGLAASGTLNLLFGSSSWLWPMVLLWTLNGWAQSAGWAPIVKTLSNHFGPSDRGRAASLFGPCYLAGHAASWLLAGYVVGSLGWRAGFWVPAALLLVVAAPAWWVLMPTPPNEKGHSLNSEPLRCRLRRSLTESLASLAGMLRDGRLLWALVACMLLGTIKEGLALWAPTYLYEALQLGYGQAAMTGLVVPLAGVLGVRGAGALVQRSRRHAAEAAVTTGVALAMAGVAAVLWLGGTLGLGGSLLLLGVLAACAHGLNGLFTTSIPLAQGQDGQVAATAGTLDFAGYVGAGLSAAAVGAAQARLGWGAVYAGWVVVALAIAMLAATHARRAERAP